MAVERVNNLTADDTSFYQPRRMHSKPQLRLTGGGEPEREARRSIHKATAYT